MKAIVGLGNPGKKYLLTRHNLGFLVIDALSEEGGSFKKEHESLVQKTKIASQSVLLVKPQTFMNLSGQAVRSLLHFYKIPLEGLIVIHDDKDLEFGSFKFQQKRGSGGHNGISDIEEKLGSNDYARLKMGVFPKKMEESSSDLKAFLKLTSGQSL